MYIQADAGRRILPVIGYKQRFDSMRKENDPRLKSNGGEQDELPVELWNDGELIEEVPEEDPEVDTTEEMIRAMLGLDQAAEQNAAEEEFDIRVEEAPSKPEGEELAETAEDAALLEEILREVDEAQERPEEERPDDAPDAAAAALAEAALAEALFDEDDDVRIAGKEPAKEIGAASAEAAAAATAVQIFDDEEVAALAEEAADEAGAAVSGATRVMDPLDFSGEEDYEEESEEEKENGKKVLWILLPILGILLVLFLLLQLLLHFGFTDLFGLDLSGLDVFGGAPAVYRELSVEIGSESISPDAFINQQKNKEHLPALFMKTGGYDLDTLGDYPMIVRFNGKDYEVTLHVVDTVAPAAVLRTALISKGGMLAEEDLLETVYDKSDIQLYVSPFDADTVGAKNVTIRLVDAAGNFTEYDTRVYVAETISSVLYEIGTAAPTPADFVTGIDGIAFAESDFAAYGVNAPGEYEITLRCGEDIMRLPLTAQDTVAPVAVAKTDVELVSSGLPDASVLLESVTDATAVTVTYKENYRFEADGRYVVTVVATDLGGNETEVDVPVFVYFSEEVTEAPLIIASDITVEIGGAVPYKQYIRIIDSVDGELDLYDPAHVTFDTAAVDTSTVGNYSLLIKAVDSEGNTSSKPIVVHVVHKSITQDEVNRYVKNILSKIITSDMTREQQLRAVFNYVKKDSGMTYTGSSDKQNLYFVEAYYGFTMNVGDCYTYCSMSRVMLDNLGIDYYVVERSGVRNSNHYWLLVDFGDGWYHFDTCYHSLNWTKDTFKLTDGEVAAFTKWYNTHYSGWNYYQFDTSLYPATPVLNPDGRTYTYTPYTVTYTASSGGSIVGEGFQKVEHGQTSAPVTAAPEAGYVFKRWSDGVTTATRSDVIKSALNVTAEFEVGSLPDKSYVLSYKASAGGYVSGSILQNVYEGYYGSEVKAIANAGYTFSGWSDGVTTPNRTDLSKANLTVTANFVPDTGSFTLKYTPGAGGTITGSTTQVLTAGATGTKVTAQPKTGYVFKGWSDGVKTAERTDKATVNLTVTALFEKAPTSFRLSYQAGQGGSVQGSSEQTVTEGSSGSSVKAVADPGYLFDSWSDGVTSAERTDSPTADLTVTARFKADPSYMRIRYAAGENGSIDGSAEQIVKIGEKTSSVTATPAEGYRFVSWSDGSSSAARSDVAVSEATYTATFEKIPVFSYTFSAREGGRITGTVSQTVTEGKTTTPVTAVANEGYHFTGWYSNGELVSSDAELTITAGSHTEYPGFVARFEKDA